VIPHRARLATWLAFCLHGVFVLTGRYRLSYDAYNHMFFGDHYRLDWWSLWEPRWYTGFEVSSYPPLVHQLIGLLGRVVGVDVGFALIFWTVLTLFPLAVYAFSRIFTGKTSSSYAALGAALLPSIYLAGHTFGQLPTLTSTFFALFGMAALHDWLVKGNRLSGALAVALTGAVMAAHHATLLFLPWAGGAVLLHIMLNHKVGRGAFLRRLTGYLLPAIAAGGLVIWPFWAWGLRQSMQAPIDHLSRHNFLVDPFAPLTFFLPVYGPLIFLIPLVVWQGANRRTLGLWGAFLGLFVLGLGGTTPLPRLLFGQGWEWLTYDRFALWASLMLLPFFGMMLVSWRRRLPARKTQVLSPRQRLSLATLSLFGLVSVIAVMLPTVLPTQPEQIDMQPLVAFLAKGDRSRWRYVTFGMGDQLAYLSRLTSATTVDGSYHTARSLPELRASGLAQIDTAFWLANGMTALDPILRKSADWGVRWGFVLFKAYEPALWRNGWVRLGTLSNGVQVWENPKATLPEAISPPVEDPLAEFSWGSLPLLALLTSAGLAGLRLRPTAAERALGAVQSLAAGLLPLGLSFWYFRTLVANSHSKVYFTYDHALFFASDALALVIAWCWALQHLAPPDRVERVPFRLDPRRVESWFLALCLLASASVFWSVDWRTTLYFSLHVWLVFGLFLALRERPALWRPFAIGGLAALTLESVIGMWQFESQSTASTQFPGLNWPGILTPATQGASVVQLADGTRWLRAYGTLPHPNILGGLSFVLLAGVMALFLLEPKYRPWLLAPVGLGTVLLVLTFSRSAWLALAVFALLLAFGRRRFERKRLVVLAVVTSASVLLAAIPAWALVFARTGGSQAAAEAFSATGRSWLMGAGWQFIRERPLAGLGAGTFIIELARRAAFGYIVEPVHNLSMLITGELGLGGGLLLAGMVGAGVLQAWRTNQPEAVLFSAALVGLGVTGLFDHYLWTLAPGRVLLGAVLGLWAGQVRLNEANR
jgi:hypothetical protein